MKPFIDAYIDNNFYTTFSLLFPKKTFQVLSGTSATQDDPKCIFVTLPLCNNFVQKHQILNTFKTFFELKDVQMDRQVFQRKWYFRFSENF